MACFYSAPLAWNPTGVDNHEILGNHFDEIDRDAAFEKFDIMRFTQAEPETGKGRDGQGHGLWHGVRPDPC